MKDFEDQINALNCIEAEINTNTHDPVKEIFKTIAFQIKEMCKDPGLPRTIYSYYNKRREIAVQKKKCKYGGKMPQTGSVAMEMVVDACKDMFEPLNNIEEQKETLMEFLRAKVDQIREIFEEELKVKSIFDD